MTSFSPLRVFLLAFLLLACLLLSVQGQVSSSAAVVVAASSSSAASPARATSAPMASTAQPMMVSSSILAAPFVVNISGCRDWPNSVTKTVTGCYGDGSDFAGLVVEGGNFDSAATVSIQGSGRVYTCNVLQAFSNDRNIQCNKLSIDAMDVNRSMVLTVSDRGVSNSEWKVTFITYGSNDMAAAISYLGMSFATAVTVFVVLALIILSVSVLCVLSCCCGVSLACLSCCVKAAAREEQNYSAMA